MYLSIHYVTSYIFPYNQLRYCDLFGPHVFLVVYATKFSTYIYTCHRDTLVVVMTYITTTVLLTMQACLDEATEPWGVKVERVEM